MVGGRGGEDRLGLAEASVHLLEALQEPRHRSGTDGHVPADDHVAPPQLARRNAEPFLGGRVLDPRQILGQRFAEAAMDFADSRGCERAALQATPIDPRLDGDVRPRFKLQIAFAGVVAVVVVQRPFDIHRVGVVPLDEVGVVAVHGPHQIGQRRQQAGGQRAAQAGGFLGQFERQIGQGGAVAGVSADQQRLHLWGDFASVGRFYVRFHVRLSSTAIFNVSANNAVCANYIGR